MGLKLNELNLKIDNLLLLLPLSILNINNLDCLFFYNLEFGIFIRSVGLPQNQDPIKIFPFEPGQ
jgi:hypothetical protein